jgi:hypothetical protein
MAKIIPFLKKNQGTPEPVPAKELDESALESVLEEIKGGYSEDEWRDMWEQLDEMYPDDENEDT